MRHKVANQQKICSVPSSSALCLTGKLIDSFLILWPLIVEVQEDLYPSCIQAQRMIVASKSHEISNHITWQRAINRGPNSFLPGANLHQVRRIPVGLVQIATWCKFSPGRSSIPTVALRATVGNYRSIQVTKCLTNQPASTCTPRGRIFWREAIKKRSTSRIP
jgi:hypothetical protein